MGGPHDQQALARLKKCCAGPTELRNGHGYKVSGHCQSGHKRAHMNIFPISRVQTIGPRRSRLKCELSE